MLRQRELGLVRDTAELLEEAAALAKAAAGEELPPARARFMAKRIGRLRMLAGAGERLLGAFVSGGILDVGALRSAADERARRGVEGGAAERTSAETDEQPAPGAGEPEEERGGA
ncbi:MAG TPA: hypothetical protein RMH26_06920, partial [Polyangiaceae bacterium LLY-WYZ-15_(1-7)]|nr:hypothetical protein [Polyangiaceae bacterium LLY-WYZ-15_(1-7)]